MDDAATVIDNDDDAVIKIHSFVKRICTVPFNNSTQRQKMIS